MTKLLPCILLLAFALILMPGLGGCAHDRAQCDPATTTQPHCSSCARAKPTCQAQQEPAVEEEEEIVLDEDRPALTKEFDRQIHNTELADMALADIHFLPNRAGLNTTGIQRLSHLAWLVDRYGGTISLDLEDTKSELAQARRQAVVRYLHQYGLPKGKVHVEFGLPQSRGMDAKEAIKVYNDTRYKSKQAEQSTMVSDMTGSAGAAGTGSAAK